MANARRAPLFSSPGRDGDGREALRRALLGTCRSRTRVSDIAWQGWDQTLRQFLTKFEKDPCALFSCSSFWLFRLSRRRASARALPRLERPNAQVKNGLGGSVA